ncbi:Na(+)-translocating NADH-quinone reductase subunit C [Kingella negevensis]|uniref:Na(+)-translocating NADH-quinone reductase subunit C n=1 Tax=Kingella negevensis TaxID=1522312 RepID=A0A238HK90_9NEIS|nr:Na(+)-translocating NADH-quinone reductase subunit C [Kingella negevensis]MDK4680822.1 Na(+)-translocating NADH-quinone reductase subunit C [Kingella negevensis]MDK4681455.1 Na(+)-translocating NADH-quinone reductase subunit C [Kingella negevensis]MDK4684262.1 Na(+)-translocating NADH-quinone reductase subunit C [Kingella negevensis]MDK4687889.1 Na(+)-translocating NADH-quinone reductase subunit C [Kingella negevensis]MDK4691841.1 Na(+)-translocating NADH-quinone reductase subunit C [Kingel
MAKFDKDSFGGTMAVVLAVSLVCSVIVAGSAIGLKPTQNEKKLLDKQKNILAAAGLLSGSNADVKTLYAERVEPRVVDLATGDYVEGLKDFDARTAAKDPEQSVAIPKEQDTATIQRRAKYAEVYLIKDTSGKLEQIVLPMHGSGLWSIMYGFVAVKADGNTINGITYYEQGETAGLGGEIANPLWQKNFVGKKLYNEKGEVAIKVAKNASADQEHGVDGLSGATMTTKGVNGSFHYWFSENGYAPYLNKIKAGAK